MCSKLQVAKFVAPKTDSANAVDAWLSENGLNATVISPAGDWLSIELPVSKANKLISADYSIFTHEGTGMQTIRTLSYAIPSDLIGHLDLIHPTITSVYRCGFPCSGLQVPL